MHIATMLYATDYAMRPDRFAVACEERGFESVWFPEHTHIPASRKTPFPVGGDLPKDYWHILDPFVSLAAAASVTTRIKLATGICLITERDPIVLAKEVASLDHLSDGRVLFGIGAGWNAEEMENHGTVFVERWKVLEERIAAMKAIWTQDDAEYHGEYVDFDPIWSFPKPVQKPHPPILMGAATSWGRQRVADFCDGWVPIPLQMDQFEADLADLRERMTRAGRDANATDISLFWAPEEEDVLKRYQELGVTRAILACPAEDEPATLKRLDAFAELQQKLA